MTQRTRVAVDGRPIVLSNLGKVLWPEVGYTKADLLAYYQSMEACLLPHWRGRFLTVTRYPHGVTGQYFYQKNVPAGAPEWVKTKKRRETEYVVADSLSTLIWLANSNAVEFHLSLDRTEGVGVPNFAVLDLDPTAPAGFGEAVEVAKHLRELLEKLRLRGYPKLSGASGLHIYIPLKAEYDFTLTQRLIRLIADTMLKAYPRLVTVERLIKNRRGIYLDYLQNDQEKTMIGMYSPRPTPGATVSTPITWEDLEYYPPQEFTIKPVPQWVAERGDLFAPVLTDGQSLENVIPYLG